MIEELNQKLIQARKELNDLKTNYTMKCKENENLQKENQDLKDEQINSKSGYGSKESTEIKKMTEEIQKLRSLNKHRDEILN